MNPFQHGWLYPINIFATIMVLVNKNKPSMHKYLSFMFFMCDPCDKIIILYYEGIIGKISYEPRVYESVYVRLWIEKRRNKEFMQLRVLTLYDLFE